MSRPRAARRGLLVALEGVDGSGKSTQCARLARWLDGLGHQVTSTREPTGGAHGQRYRRWARGEIELGPEAVLELFVLDRREHVRQTIAPALERGGVVLCDRYVASTLAYQVAHGADRDALAERLGREQVPEADLTLWLRIPVESALRRLGHRSGATGERYERREFLERVEAEYARLGLDEVDADASEPEVEEALRARLAPLVAESGAG